MFHGVNFSQSLVFYVVFYPPILIVFSFSSWSLYCLSFFTLLLLVAPFVSSQLCLCVQLPSVGEIYSIYHYVPLFKTTTTHSFGNLTDSQDIIKV